MGKRQDDAVVDKRLAAHRKKCFSSFLAAETRDAGKDKNKNVSFSLFSPMASYNEVECQMALLRLLCCLDGPAGSRIEATVRAVMDTAVCDGALPEERAKLVSAVRAGIEKRINEKVPGGASEIRDMREPTYATLAAADDAIAMTRVGIHAICTRSLWWRYRVCYFFQGAEMRGIKMPPVLGFIRLL